MSPGDKGREGSGRHVLPKTVKPVHYDIKLTPSFEDFTYAGEEAVTLKVLEDVDRVVLNIREIDIKKAAILLADGTRLQGQIAVDTAEETATFTFGQIIPVQEAVLLLDFVGVLNDEMCGAYRSHYVRPDGTKSWIATTQMEPADARRAFPCWDEPNAKATFKVKLVVLRGMTALGNMHVAKQTDLPGTDLTEVEFHTTPVMSTYLVAFVVGNFDYVEDHTTEGVCVRTYTPEGLAEQGRFALDVAVKTLSFFSQYFDIPYPLEKLDQIAIPDFAMGAMENWGLVTYRAVALLYDPSQTPADYQQRIAYIVAHELAHQWFGNLVTMDWWNDLWLNEGFATWVGTLAVDHIFPEWLVWDRFIHDEVKEGLLLDSLAASHPIEVEVDHARQVDEIFDSISYAKGASMVHMLATYLGMGSFCMGLRQYLKEFAYRNTVTNDLWTCLSKASGKDVKSMMNTWTKQTGYPVVSLEEREDGIMATQTRFLSQGSCDDPTLWMVPLRLHTRDAGPSDDVLDMERQKVVPHPGQGDGWWKANKDQAGFYRVQYPDTVLAKLGKALEARELSAADRIGIIGDVFALSVAGRVPTTQALELLLHCRQEDNYSVWCDILTSIKEMQSVWYMEDKAVLEQLKALERHLYQPIVDQLGWEPVASEKSQDRLLRPMVLAAAGRAGDRAVIEKAQRLFEDCIGGNRAAIHPDLKGAVFTLVLLNDKSDQTYNTLVDIYENSKAEDEKITILRVIGSAPTTDLVQRTLDYSLSDKVRKHNLASVLAYCAMNPVGRRMTWDFVKVKWPVLVDSFGKGTYLLGRIVSYSTDKLVSDEEAAEVEMFFQTNGLPTIERSVLQSVETIRANARWFNGNRTAVATWLKKNAVW